MSSGDDKEFNLWNYQPNPSEQAVLDDCARSAFRRFIPTSIVLGGATLFGISRGYLKASPRFGSAPKLLLASFLSYFLCQLSVSGECREKLKRLPDSPLADYIKTQER
ncbi:OCIA domain-containing protein 1-like isoform X2 [Diaphorina citri]|uniref:OCIA domain-containing protein 1-like isoform X1 n=1 Tax=Diaphorina citri TaxID=121845 RepID=A0A1S3D0E6_DIACI|nr:OCIA domain-containing protein 1-like isoform X1 [Diaphorina citri]XP_026679144.1 OCIA domain-containing protein 1-like isoform X2 [Diaphorina citri]KAI5710321.1 hypothetical protein M8J75_007652 [Diaphorina citri]KAI5745146.1 hypothetical protein M8J76_008622 [Diaphorina citri]KAI5751633.1 hypothetical protein M8J77_009417 [Diaphorina citri]